MKERPVGLEDRPNGLEVKGIEQSAWRKEFSPVPSLCPMRFALCATLSALCPRTKCSLNLSGAPQTQCSLNLSRAPQPTEVETLLGDATKAREHLGWRPEISFKSLVEEMVQEDLEEAKKDKMCQDHGFRTFNNYE